MKKQSLELPFSPPMITINSIMTEMESDTDTMSPANIKSSSTQRNDMCYLSPFTSVVSDDRTISESNLSSSGYSSMASPAPSRCGSNNPLYVYDMDDCPTNGKYHKMLTIRRSSSHGKTCDHSSHDILFESNDEDGASDDHIDEQIHRIKANESSEHLISATDAVLDTGKNISLDEPLQMQKLQLPTIIIQTEGAGKKTVSPNSSRSESPIR